MNEGVSLAGFLLAGQNLPFAVALGLLFVIGLLEGGALLLGGGLSGFIESHLHVDADLDGEIDVHALGWVDRMLGWLHVGRVPVLVVLVLFLAFFALSGFALQSVVWGLTGYLLPAPLAAAPACFAALPGVRLVARGIAKVIPKDETEAISRDSFVGRVATITRGTARVGAPAEAKFKDQHGQTHYVLVEPDGGEDTFGAGDEVVIVRAMAARFAAIRATSVALSAKGSGGEELR